MVCLHLHVQYDRFVFLVVVFPFYFMPHVHVCMYTCRCMTLSSTAYKVEDSDLVFGLCHSVKLDVFFPGFPTLKHVNHEVNLWLQIYRKLGIFQVMVIFVWGTQCRILNCGYLCMVKLLVCENLRFVKI